MVLGEKFVEEVVVMGVRGFKEFYRQGEYRIGRGKRNIGRRCNGRHRRCFRCPLFHCRHFSLSLWLLCPHPHPYPTSISLPFCWGLGPYQFCIVCLRRGRNIVFVNMFPRFCSRSSPQIKVNDYLIRRCKKVHYLSDLILFAI